MDRAQVERISARTALGVGFAITIGLWTYTGFAVSQQLAGVKAGAAELTARYDQSQQLLMTVRTQVLLISVRVRDALLARSPRAVAESREEMEESFHLISMAIEDYEPIARAATDGDQLLALRLELDRFEQTSLRAVGLAPGRSVAAIRAVLNEQLMPRREAALSISEEIQTLNRQAYIGHQNDIGNIYEAADRSSRRQLGVALALSLGVLLMTSFYAARLDARLQMQLEREAHAHP